jgi:hypothetical protein
VAIQSFTRRILPLLLSTRQRESDSNYSTPMPSTIHAYEFSPPKDHRGVDLISDALPFPGQDSG